MSRLAPTVLVVDDDAANLRRMEQALGPLGMTVHPILGGEAALARLGELADPFGFPGVVLTDLKMPGMDGLELLDRALRADADLPVIVISAYGDVATAVQAMKAGAYDFVERPFDVDDLAGKVARAQDKRDLVLDNRRLRAELVDRSGIATRLIGNSAGIQALRDDIAAIAATDATVLVHGQTGTGKEVVARALHDCSARAKANFVAINCGALSESVIESELFGHEPGAFTDARQRRIGLVEHARGGTLFLDEIESMPMKLQVKLLRMLQERVIVRLGSNVEIKVDVRVVAATKTDLLEAAGRGEFREDLFFRLDVASLRIPPLNERREDIPLLFNAFVREFSRQYGRPLPSIGRDDVEQLLAHDWRGNVRELRNVAERFVLGLGRRIGEPGALLTAEGARPRSLTEQVDAIEALLIQASLREHRGSVQATSEALGLPRRTLYEKMRKHGLDRVVFRG
jgi:two-component system, NtrC family, C4-dicarboxylate transport response regulator DctD